MYETMATAATIFYRMLQYCTFADKLSVIQHKFPSAVIKIFVYRNTFTTYEKRTLYTVHSN